VNHPHIVEITDFVEERDMGRVWCVMEYLQGSTLKVLGRDQTLPIARSVKIIRQVCDALDAAHRVGVVHRDIKPDNIFLVAGKGDDEEDFVKVLDFGVAKLREERGGDAGHTESGEIVGTPAYMSPEQAMGQEVDHRSDLYSLGTLLYVLLAGRFPFDGVTAGQLVANIVARPPLPLPKVARSGEEISEELDAVVMKCLEKSPHRRYHGMRALAEALVPFETTQKLMTVSDDDLISIEDSGIIAAADPVDVDMAEPPRSSRGRAVFFGVAVVMLAGAAIAGRIVWPEEAARLGVGGGDSGGTSARAATGSKFTDVQGGPVEVASEPPRFVVPPAVSGTVAKQVAAGTVKVAKPAAPAPAKKASKKRTRR
jgi:serine/threonine protein kinase